MEDEERKFSPRWVIPTLSDSRPNAMDPDSKPTFIERLTSCSCCCANPKIASSC